MNPVSLTVANTEVRWEGTDVGLMPELVTGQSEAISSLNEGAIPDLIEALSDRELFVVAHVLLTRVSGVEYTAFPAWNHLAVEIGADGSVTIDPEQRHRLAAAWRQWCKSNPRPRRLPLVD